MKYQAAVRYLLSLGRELAAPTQAAAAKFDLENITILAERLGSPERTYPSAHIAGTNGKGSTAAFLESVLRHLRSRPGRPPRRHQHPFTACLHHHPHRFRPRKLFGPLAERDCRRKSWDPEARSAGGLGRAAAGSP